jgi:hypothetical protein
LLWAVILRCIPDKYAATVFSFADKVWMALYRPVMKVLHLVFHPVAKTWRALSKSVFSPTKRFTKRAMNKVRSKSVSEESNASDEERMIGTPLGNVLPTQDKGKASVPQTPITPPELRVQPPPITLTTADV